MDQNIIQPRFYADTFGGEYAMDHEENLGYRTPFRDADSKEADHIFDVILQLRRAKGTNGLEWNSGNPNNVKILQETSP